MTEQVVLEREVATKPRNTWHNWWRLLNESNLNPFQGGYVYASKEAAERDAARQIELMPDGIVKPATYLGAFPDGERP